MYKRIMVAVDGSDVSDRALSHAMDLARDQGATLKLVHVVDVATLNWDLEFADMNEIRGAVRKRGLAVLQRAEAAIGRASIQVETQLIEIDTLSSRIPDMVVQAAVSWPADLLVIGTHGRRGLGHLLLGSVAEGVIRHAETPVLLIRTPRD